jgi:hypothetical protein
MQWTLLGWTNLTGPTRSPVSPRVLTAEGWEEANYIDPGDEWRLLDDGSWASPEGLTRSWRLGGPEPAEPH